MAEEQRFFGRLHAPDSRDAAFPMRLMLDPIREVAFPRGIPEGTRHYNTGPILNQGATGTCVAHGWTSKANGAPIMQPTGLHPYDLYRKIVLVDEWRENDREATAPNGQLQSGTSVRAGAKVLQSMGLLQSYLWAESVDDVRAWHLAGKGGIVLGTTWKSDMMKVDSDGFVSYTGRDEGGHCYVTKGWSDTVKRGGRKVRAARCQQSWGDKWGQKGFFWFSEEDLAKAIADYGEACAATEVRITAQQ